MRLIDADVLKRDMYEACFDDDYYFKKEMQKWDSGNWIRYKVFEEILAKQPPAEKIGKWIKIGEYDDVHAVQCSECLEDFAYIDGVCYLCHSQELPNYCPNCGAKMVNEDETN